TGTDSPDSVKMRVIPHLRPTRPIGILLFLLSAPTASAGASASTSFARWQPEKVRLPHSSAGDVGDCMCRPRFGRRRAGTPRGCRQRLAGEAREAAPRAPPPATDK